MSVRDLTILGCSSQQPTRLRNHNAYLLRWNDEGLLFDPGEGTQRQFIYANIAPPTVTRIFISHFHGDHCLGLGSMLMRLNLDKVTHPVHCYYPASGKKYFDRLRFGTIYHDHVNVVEHPVKTAGIVHQDDTFTITADFLKHGNIDNIGWRIQERDTLKFDKEKITRLGIRGPLMQDLIQNESIEIDGKKIHLSDVSRTRHGDIFTAIIDTLPCEAATHLAQDATMLLCESTYLDEHQDHARRYKHMTAKQAAKIAKDANAKELILTHFSARYRNLELFEEEARTIFPNTHAADDLKTFPFPKS